MRIQNIINSQTKPIFNGVSIEQAPRIIKTPIKILFSDIDNTILKNGKISKEHFSSIRELIDSGVKLVISTGRGYSRLGKLFKKLGMKPDIAITSGGATIVDKDLKKLRDVPLLPSNIENLINLSKEYQNNNIFFRFTIEGIPYFDNLKGLILNRGSHPEYTDSYETFINENKMPTKGVFVIFPEPKSFTKVQQLGEEIKQKLNDENLSVVNSEKKYCEVMRSDAMKGDAVQFLKEYLGYDYENIACIGDAENDESMTSLLTQNGGMSISMGNGTDRMKEIARFVTSDVDNFGFSKAVDTILEINKNFK